MTDTSTGSVLVIIPTYNERDTLPVVVARTRAAVPEADILVADDNSPDGTGGIADELAADDKHIHVLHREGKQGLGAAYLAGFRWGSAHGYDSLVEMDADDPESLTGWRSSAGHTFLELEQVDADTTSLLFVR